MPKKNDQPVTFEQTLVDLEQIVQRLESGNLPLEQALTAFEQGIKLARSGQQTLKLAEQRVQILLDNDVDAELTEFHPDQSS